MRSFRLLRVLALSLAALVYTAPPSSAVVGGSDAAPGEFPEMADITFGIYACGGTLIDATHVLSAGHCGSVTTTPAGPVSVASPAAWPTVLIDVKIGSNRYGEGESVPVKSVTISPDYLGLSLQHDISVLELQRAPATNAPVKVAGASERSAWDPGDLAAIAGWGLTDPNDDASWADDLQQAQVPITTDAYCADAYGGDFDSATMVCAGYPEGGVDTCSGDSGGPLLGVAADSSRRVVGVTSWGAGCAEAEHPGVYARVADTKLRTWLQSVAPNGVGS